LKLAIKEKEAFAEPLFRSLAAFTAETLAHKFRSFNNDSPL
jgi:hypothetical protein